MITRVIAWDTETALIRPGSNAPEIVCLSYQVHHVHGRPVLLLSEQAQLAHWKVDALQRLEEWLLDPQTLLVGHHVAFDVGVVCAQWPHLTELFFRAYDANRVTCTQVRQKLLDIAAGQYRGKMGEKGKWIKYDYNLDALTKRLAGIKLDKDTWRLEYGRFRNLPLPAWPEGARTYPKDDARATLLVYLAQEKHKEFLDDQYRQTRAALSLNLMSTWGLRTTKAGVDSMRVQTEEARAEVKQSLVAAGLVRPDGSRDTKAAARHMVKVCRERQDEAIAKGMSRDVAEELYAVRVTEAGEKRVEEWDAAGDSLRVIAERLAVDGTGVCLDEDACKASEDETLGEYSEYVKLGNVLNKDIKALAKGIEYPVHTRFDLAETGRTTSSSPNVQNWRRLPGIRECFVPRPGNVFIDCDYDQLELRTLAQACICLVGHSRLADVLNSGLDPHTELASQILGVPAEEGRRLRKAKDKRFDDARQTAKVANFGFPGGLGAPKLVKFAWKSYKVKLTVERARELKREWLHTWPELDAYFSHVNQLCANPHGLAFMKQLFSNRIRGGAHYTAACNSYFQGLGADATKEAGYELAKECYTVRTSPLYGARPVNYVHDQFITEVRDTTSAHDAAYRQAAIMIAVAEKWTPDVRSKTEPVLCRFWSKDAAQVLDANGRLVPWEGKKT